MHMNNGRAGDSESLKDRASLVIRGIVGQFDLGAKKANSSSVRPAKAGGHAKIDSFWRGLPRKCGRRGLNKRMDVNSRSESSGLDRSRGTQFEVCGYSLSVRVTMGKKETAREGQTIARDFKPGTSDIGG